MGFAKVIWNILLQSSSEGFTGLKPGVVVSIIRLELTLHKNILGEVNVKRNFLPKSRTF